MLAVDMKKNLIRPHDNDNEPGRPTDDGIEPLLGSGFEEEQPEPDFDERM